MRELNKEMEGERERERKIDVFIRHTSKKDYLIKNLTTHSILENMYINIFRKFKFHSPKLRKYKILILRTYLYIKAKLQSCFELSSKSS